MDLGVEVEMVRKVDPKARRRKIDRNLPKSLVKVPLHSSFL